MSDHAEIDASGRHLLVPINIEALVCGKNAAATEWVDLTPEFRGIPFNQFLGRQMESEPCGSTSPDLYAQPGVYLHWALPDGLTHGVAADNGGQPQFPLIPNRWLIVRLMDQGGENQAVEVKFKAWIVESDSVTDDEDALVWPRLAAETTGRRTDYYVHVGKHFEAAQWPGETRAPRVDITACGYGAPGFAAYYPSCRGILGFHDQDLPDSKDSISLTYFVAGWYGDPSQDPLNRTMTEKSIGCLDQFLSEKKWTYPGFEAALEKARQAADLDTRLQEAQEMVLRLKQGRVRFDARSRVFGNSRQINDKLQRGETELQKEIARLQERRSALATPIEELEKNLPDQIICHGVISEIQWTGKDFLVADGVPRGKSFTLAVGNTAMEALGALFQKQLTGDLLGLLEAFQYDLLADLDQPGGHEKIAQKIHEKTFRPLARGVRWELIQEEPTSDGSSAADKSPPIPGEIRLLLENLNQRQREINRLRREQDSARSELYATWYKKVLNAGADAAREGILNQRLTDLQEQIESLTARIAELADAEEDRPRGAEWDQLRGKLAVFCPDWQPQKLDEPRFWQPNDPVVLLAGQAFERSFRHGEDGRYRSDGKLLCRRSGQEITAMKLTIPHAVKPDVEFGPQDLDQWCRPFSAAGMAPLPLPVSNLFRESLFLTLDSKRAHAIAVATYEKNEAGLAKDHPQEVKEFAHDLLDKYLKQVWQAACKPDSNSPDLRYQDGPSAYELVGTFPSPVVKTTWRQNPWLPLFLQWQLNWIPAYSDGEADQTSWQLTGCGTTFDWGGAEPSQPNLTKTLYSGTTLLAPSAGWQFGERLRTYNLAHDNSKLKEFQTAVSLMNILCQSLGGLTEQLLMRKARLELSPLEPGNEKKGPRLSPICDQVEDIDWLSPLIDKPFFPLRAGHFRLERLWIIDAFGQLLKLEEENQASVARPLLAGSLTGFDGHIRLEPRLAQPARLFVQWPPADLWDPVNPKDRLLQDDEAFDPVCGWILPNFLDRGLMIYDARGNALGALQAVQRKSWAQGAGAQRKEIESFHWVDMPGSDAFFFGKPSEEILDPLGEDANPHLRAFVKGLLSLTEESGPAFSRLLDKMDQTLGAFGGSGQNPNLALLIGKPLALVRASIRLELNGRMACAQGWNDLQGERTGGLETVKFQIRLGDRRKWHDSWIGDDGLVGFFMNHDYSRFYPAYRLEDRNDTYNHFGFVPTISFDQPLDLTLLMDPSRGVCATTGILPRKIFHLPYSDLIETLENKEIVFFAGPIISTAAEIRMPQPSDAYGQWSWNHHPAVKIWREEPIIDYQKQQGQFFEQSLQISEGWLKLITAPLAIRDFKVKGREPIQQEKEVQEKGQAAEVDRFEVSPAEPFMLTWAVTGAEAIELRAETSVLFRSGCHPLPTQYRMLVDQKTCFTLTAFGRPQKSADAKQPLGRTVVKTIEVGTID
jgi:hypothetical protein